MPSHAGIVRSDKPLRHVKFSKFRCGSLCSVGFGDVSPQVFADYLISILVAEWSCFGKY